MNIVYAVETINIDTSILAKCLTLSLSRSLLFQGIKANLSIKLTDKLFYHRDMYIYAFFINKWIDRFVHPMMVCPSYDG